MRDKYPYVVKTNAFIENKKETFYSLIYANNMSEVMQIIENYYGVDIEDCTITNVGCAGQLFEVNKETAKLLIEGKGTMYGK